MTNERAIQILENLIVIDGDIIIGDEGREALEMAVRSLQQEQQEEPDKSLEEAAEEFAEQEWDGLHDTNGNALYTEDYIKYTFIAGAEWQKEQMLKDAEECELYWDGDSLAIDLNMVALGYSERDKVKVIVLKAEEG